MEWHDIEDHPNRCKALCNTEGNKITDIFAKVWCLDSGEWAYACNSDIWKGAKLFAGKKPTRELAITAVNSGIGMEDL